MDSIEHTTKFRLIRQNRPLLSQYRVTYITNRKVRLRVPPSYGKVCAKTRLRPPYLRIRSVQLAQPLRQVFAACKLPKNSQVLGSKGLGQFSLLVCLFVCLFVFFVDYLRDANGGDFVDSQLQRWVCACWNCNHQHSRRHHHHQHHHLLQHLYTQHRPYRPRHIVMCNSVSQCFHYMSCQITSRPSLQSNY